MPIRMVTGMKHRIFESVNAARGLERRNLLAILVATALAGCATLPAGLGTSPTLADIVQRNTEARGGASALDRMSAVAIDVEILEGGQALMGRYAATKDGLVRIDIYVDGKHAGSEGIDAGGVWILTKDGPAPSVATGAGNALLHGAVNHLFGWNRFPERGHELALMPSETIDGLTYPVVEVTYSTSHKSYFYVDPDSWKVVRRRDVRAYHPDVSLDKKQVESRSLDFQTVDGVVAAHRNEDYDLGTGKLLSINRVLKRVVNPMLPAGYFDRNRRTPANL